MSHSSDERENAWLTLMETKGVSHAPHNPHLQVEHVQQLVVNLRRDSQTKWSPAPRKKYNTLCTGEIRFKIDRPLFEKCHKNLIILLCFFNKATKCV